MNKKLWAIIVGYGNRGDIYASYSLVRPEELGIYGVVDPNPFKLRLAKEKFHLEDSQLFLSLEDCLKQKPACDFFLNATMDQQHYEVLQQILSAGYNVLTEKPIVEDAEKLLKLKALAEQNHCSVLVGHVLRYTPFYKAIKKFVLEGKLGKIFSIELNEFVGISHYISSYVRGKWNSEKECGSGFLLAKSCHDLDIMCWLNNETKPTAISSFGGRYYFTEENAPEGSTKFCYDCPYERDCLYSAIRQYYENDWSNHSTWIKMNKAEDEITQEDKYEFLKHDDMGKCVFKVEGADIVDRQNIIVNFENGSLATFSLVGGAPQPNRTIHIVGSLGEIEGIADEGKFTFMKADKGLIGTIKETIDVTGEIFEGEALKGHMGGDYEIMKAAVAFFNGDRSCISITSIEDSINGHMCVYAAEKARREKRIVELEEYNDKI